MKLYYTQPERICEDVERLFVIYVDKGVCWDEWHSISDICNIEGVSKIRKGSICFALHNYMEWLTICDGRARDFFQEADNDYKYSETELFTRHPDATLFDRKKFVYLNPPVED